MLEIAESPDPSVEIGGVIGQVFWCIVSCAQIVSLVILTPRIGVLINVPSQLGAETFLSLRTSPLERYARMLSVEPLRMRLWRVSRALKATYRRERRDVSIQVGEG